MKLDIYRKLKGWTASRVKILENLKKLKNSKTSKFGRDIGYSV